MFIAVFFISFTLAEPSLTLQQENIQPGETIFATIETSGKFIEEISKSDIKFLDGRKEVFFEFDVKFYEGVHYFYAYAINEGNYTFEISDILYKESEELKSAKIVKNISIVKNLLKNEDTNETSYQILSIKPGYIFSLDTPNIKLINSESYPLNVSYSGGEITLPAFGSKEIEFLPEEVFSYFNISSYRDFSIPVIYPPANESFYIEEDLDLKSNPVSLLVNLVLEAEGLEIIELFNFGDGEITNMTFSSGLEFLEIEEFDTIQGRGNVNLTLKFSPERLGYFQDELKIDYSQSGFRNSFRVPLDIFVLPVGSVEEDFEISSETCSEKEGSICTSAETCEGDASITKGGVYCCLGSCVEVESGEESERFSWFFGLLIFVILGVIGYLIYKKSRKVAPSKPEEKLKESSDNYAERIKGNGDTKRVKGELGRG